ncbi:MAG: 2-oxoglutarate dehydrogenase, E1 subunit, partial [uncultured bacterium]
MNTKSKLSQSQATDSDHYTPSGNERYLEILYDTYLTAPDTLSVEWRQYFDELSRALPRKAPDVPHEPIRDYFIELAQHPPVVSALQSVPAIEMMTAFRRLGHLEADIDPLKLMPPHGSPLLSLDYYGSTDVSLYQKLRRTYCHTIGFEYMHINRTEEVEWIRARIENEWVNFQPSTAIKQHLLERLVAADSFEKYLGFKYVGQKRFSLEGGDALIPLLDTIIHHGATFNVKEMVIGMAHRGRLNVLINVLGKSPAELFASFEGKQIQSTDVGDVKYHLGYSSDLKTEHGTVHLALAFNPSHLEIVSPVVQGSVRARQRRRRDTVQ